MAGEWVSPHCSENKIEKRHLSVSIRSIHHCSVPHFALRVNIFTHLIDHSYSPTLLPYILSSPLFSSSSFLFSRHVLIITRIRND